MTGILKSASALHKGGLSFDKMHSLGNDFVILEGGQDLKADFVRCIADRRLGVGCDQVMLVSPSSDAGVHAFVRIYNADGSEVEACGNGTRCVVWKLAAQYGQPDIMVETKAGRLKARVMADNVVEVQQGQPKLLSPDPLDLSDAGFQKGYAVSMGNPHLVIPVSGWDPKVFHEAGRRLEKHPFFPNKTNVAFVTTIGDIKLWMWERGTGPTPACASGTSAAIFALMNAGTILDGTCPVHLDHGLMWVTWRSGQPISHRATASFVASGTLCDKAIASA